MTGTYRADARGWRRGYGGLILGQFSVENDLMSTNAFSTEAILEALFNCTGDVTSTILGRPIVRGKLSGGGPGCGYLCTQVAGGADLAESTGGDTYNFAGVVAFNMIDRFREYNTAPNNQKTIFVDSITTAPVPGDTLTQAVSLATGEVVAINGLTSAQSAALFLAYNFVTFRDLGTGTWNTTNNVTSDNAGAVMAPTPIVPDIISHADTLTGNMDSDDPYDLIPDTTHELMLVLVEGITMAWVDDYNGSIADGSPLTWPDYGQHLVLASYHDVTIPGDNGTAVYVNSDNIIAHALQAHSGGATEEFRMVHIRPEKPLVKFTAGVATTPGNQGVDPEIQQ